MKKDKSFCIFLFWNNISCLQVSCFVGEIIKIFDFNRMVSGGLYKFSWTTVISEKPVITTEKIVCLSIQIFHMDIQNSNEE